MECLNRYPACLSYWRNCMRVEASRSNARGCCSRKSRATRNPSTRIVSPPDVVLLRAQRKLHQPFSPPIRAIGVGQETVTGVGQGQVLGSGRRPNPASDAVLSEVYRGDVRDPSMQVGVVKVVNYCQAQGSKLPAPRLKGSGGSIEKSRRMGVHVSRIPQGRFAGLLGTRRGVVGMFKQPMDGKYTFVGLGSVPGNAQL